jgi:hypothetical protein
MDSSHVRIRRTRTLTQPVHWHLTLDAPFEELMDRCADSSRPLLAQLRGIIASALSAALPGSAASLLSSPLSCFISCRSLAITSQLHRRAESHATSSISRGLASGTCWPDSRWTSMHCACVATRTRTAQHICSSSALYTLSLSLRSPARSLVRSVLFCPLSSPTCRLGCLNSSF